MAKAARVTSPSRLDDTFVRNLIANPLFLRTLAARAHRQYLYEREKATFIKIFGAEKWKRPAPQ